MRHHCPRLAEHSSDMIDPSLILRDKLHNQFKSLLKFTRKSLRMRRSLEYHEAAFLPKYLPWRSSYLPRCVFVELTFFNGLSLC